MIDIYHDTSEILLHLVLIDTASESALLYTQGRYVKLTIKHIAKTMYGIIHTDDDSFQISGSSVLEPIKGERDDQYFFFKWLLLLYYIFLFFFQKS